MLFILTAAFSTVIALRRDISRRAKFRSRKRHGSKERARIVFLGRDAFLIGNTVLCCVNEVLCRAHYSYHREYTQGNGKITSVVIGKSSVYTRRYGFRDIVAATTAATATILVIPYLNVKDYGVYYFYYSSGNVFA